MKPIPDTKQNPRPMHISLSCAMDDADSLLNRARQLEYDALDIDLNWPKMKLITILAEAGEDGMSLTELAKACMRELSTVSSLLLKLENDGLVERISGRRRERRRFILSESGRGVFNRVRNSSSGMFFDTLSESEQAELLELLQKLISNGKEMLGIDFIPKFLQ